MYGPLQIEEAVGIFVSQLNAHQNLTSVGEDFSSQVVTLTHYMDSSQPLSSVIFAIVQSAREQKDKVAKMQVMYGISNMDFQLLIFIRV